MSKRKDILGRSLFVYGLICCFAVAIVAKSAYITVAEGEHWRSKADSMSFIPRTVEGKRGNIYTENGDLLATSLHFFEVRIDFASDAMTDAIFNKHLDSLAICLSKFKKDKSINSYKRELIANRNRGSRSYFIAKNIGYEKLDQIKSWPFFKEGKYKSGMVVTRTERRKLPFGHLAHRTIGYSRTDGTHHTQVGLEGMFDSYLSGDKEEVVMKRIAGGAYVPVDDSYDALADAGKDIYTTLDVNIQDVATSALLKKLKYHNAAHGSVIVMEVKTGKIKAIANLKKNNKGNYIEAFNHAIGTRSEPGSTFKLASLLALLEDGYINVNDSIDLENGKKKYYDRIMKDSHPPKDNTVTIKTAFANSSNVGISKLVVEHYGDRGKRFFKQLFAFNLHKKTEIEIRGEPEPMIESADLLSDVKFAWSSIGYGVSITPLQMLTLYNTVANNGKMMKPYLVTAIKEYQSEVETFGPEVLDRSICSRSTIKTAQELLLEAVESGTAKNIKTPNYKIAGKTGTARVAKGKEGYSTKIYRASFAGYFPADKPQYSCIVVIDEPKQGGFYGNIVAAPVFKEIADKIYASGLDLNEDQESERYYVQSKLPRVKNGYKQDLDILLDELKIAHATETEADWIYTSNQDHQVKLKEREIIENLVPNVRGMGLRDAIYLLENNGLSVKIVGRGRVKQQSLRPGERANNRTIVLTLG